MLCREKGLCLTAQTMLPMELGYVKPGMRGLGPLHRPVNGASWAVCRDYGFVKRAVNTAGINKRINLWRMGDSAMREKGSVTAFFAVTAAIGATVFASATARAVPMAYPGPNNAAHKATSAQEVKYICRGSHRHRCYYASVARSSERPPGYYPWNKGVWGNMYPGQDEYNVHYWGSPANGGR